MKKTALLLCVLMLLSLLGCGGVSGTETTAPRQTEAGTTEPQPAALSEIALTDPSLQTSFVCEDNYRVFYEIFVGSFSDSNGDGIGDLRGIINRMDYLNDGDPNSGKSLGVEGLWLTPIFQSPSYHKYDVTDFYTVDPSFGTVEDLKELVALCHARNVKLILDLPINHTAKNCKWFSEFVLAQRNGEVDSDAYDFYSHCSAEEKKAGVAYGTVTGTDQYYECNFWSEMPELNFDSQAVRQTVLDVAKFYLDLGVDGFRFDAAKYIYYNDNPKSVEFWSWYLAELRAVKPELYTVAEVWDSDTVTDQYYPALNCFNFTISQTEGLISATAQKGDANRLAAYEERYLNTVKAKREDAMLVPFIANHDTDRSAGYLPSLNGYAQMAANLLLLGPGSPFLYYGEELGMRGSRGGANTDANRRLAMVWGDGDTVKDPEGASYPADSRADATAVEQMASASSLYNYYKKVILLRKANPEIARGDYKALSIPDSKVGGFVSEWNGSKVLVLHNTTGSAATLDLAALGLGEFTQISGFAGMKDAVLEGTTLTLGSQTSVVLR